ncbi:MAG: trigger factor [Bacteroidales bacterium]|jgi:trigger factor
MNIVKENIGDLNAVLKIKLEKADYEGKVDNVLKDYRKKANIKGFRPGMVPIGLISKMYGKAVKIDEINKCVSESIHKYLTDEKIEILGDPMPKPDEQENFNFDTQDDFTFSFEIGLAPVIELNISKKNKVISYDIAIDEKMRNDYISGYTRRFGQFLKADITEDKDIIKGRIEAADEAGNVIPGGPSNDSSSLAIDIIKEEEIKKSFLGKKENEIVVFDIKKAFPNENEVAGLLKKKKEEIQDIQGNFIFTIAEITRFHPSEIGQELFDRIYGEGVIKSEEEFMKKIDEELTASLKNESGYKLMQDVKKLTVESTEVPLPDDFLKRWLLKVNEKTTVEQIDKEFESFRQDLKWQLIKNKIARDNEISIKEEELQKEAETITRNQFRQYGLFYATDEQISNYAKETLKREDDAKRIADKILDDKTITFLEEIVEIVPKNVAAEEFNKLFE